jgi:hypothetical protein
MGRFRAIGTDSLYRETRPEFSADILLDDTALLDGFNLACQLGTWQPLIRIKTYFEKPPLHQPDGR